MVPEINLTPQLEARFRARFAPLYGEGAVVSLHSGMTNPQRLKSWLAAHSGAARIVLGTRMAVFASMPALRLIVVDEEHDPSYKQQEGARYSARDLAVYRGRLDGAKVLLGSATPSLESWHQSRPASAGDGGRYLRLVMPGRIGEAGFPTVRRVDMNHQPMKTVFSPPLLDAIRARIARGEQCHGVPEPARLRPGAALRRLRLEERVPALQRVPRVPQDRPHAALPPLRLHRARAARLPGLRQPRHCAAGPRHRAAGGAPGRTAGRRDAGPDGTPVRIARIDADTTRLKGALESQLAQVHSGEVDVLVGTQMIAKGHDFRRITLVAAVNPDGALFSSDFRAPERLFSLLMQAAGRAGRDAAFITAGASGSEMWIQTFHPTHPLFEALKQHDYPAFAARNCSEREAGRHAALQLSGAGARRGAHAGSGARLPERCERRGADRTGSPARVRRGDAAHHAVSARCP